MHILEIASFLPPLGGNFCLEQAAGLKSRGNEVRVLSCNQLGLTITPRLFFTSRIDDWWENMNGVDVLRTNLRGFPKAVHCNQKRWVKSIVRLYKKYERRFGRPDVLQAHCAQWAGVAASEISRTTGIPYFVTEHLSSGIYSAYGKGWSRHIWAKELLRNTLESARCVIPVSDELVDDLAPYFGKDYRWKSISNMIDVDFFKYRKRDSIEGRKYKFVCLALSTGAELYRKGYDVLSNAIKQLDDIELHIAGASTSSNQMVRLFPNAILHGNLCRDEVRDLLYECDALVLPTRSEAQGLVVLEALSTGIPVVTTEAVPKNVIVEGPCLLAKIGDADSLAECMRKVQNVIFKREWSDEVARRVSPNIIAEQIENVLKC